MKDVCEADDDLGFVVVRDRQAPSGKKLMTGTVVVTIAQRKVRG